MSMRFYNTLTRRLEEFREIEKDRIGLYTCGPTVYDYPHIGNFRSYVFEDLVKRFFLFLGYRVTHVMNITDIDDKTIRKANELGVPLAEVTQKYIDAFHADLRALNILPADVYPRATGHIPEMLKLISVLLEKGFAYAKDGSVYFSIERFKEYGRLANLDRASLKTGTRPSTPTNTKRRRSRTSSCGRAKSRASHPGRPPSARGARAGISSARP